MEKESSGKNFIEEFEFDDNFLTKEPEEVISPETEETSSEKDKKAKTKN